MLVPQSPTAAANSTSHGTIAAHALPRTCGGMSMLGRLYIEEGERPARMIELTGAVTIGRTADNDIVLESDGVSHCHAMLLAQPDGVTLLDLGSTFGTFVDAVQALPDEPLRLPNGARITIGRALLRYAAPATVVR